MSRGGSLVSAHVGLAVEHVATDVLAAHLPGLDAATLKSLPARLDELPAGGSMADELLRGEKMFPGWFVKKVRGIKDRDELVEFLDYCHGGAGRKDDFPRGKAFPEACGGTAEGILARCEAARPFAYEAFDGGFGLKSELELDDKPWALTVGVRK